MIPTALSGQEPRSLWRPGRILLGLLVLLSGAAGAQYYYACRAAEKHLREAVAEADRLDPGWRLKDILKNQRFLPDEANGALQRVAVERALPSGWDTSGITSTLPKVPPQCQLPADLTARLRTKLRELSATVQAARRLAQAPEGSDPVTWARKGYVMTFSPYLPALEVAQLLSCDAAVRARDRDLDGALASCRAIVGTGRTLGEGPDLMRVLVRLAIDRVAQGSLERILAQGEPSEAALAELQRLLEGEAARPLFLTALRGERAAIDQRLEELEAGQRQITDFVRPASHGWIQPGRFALEAWYYSLRSGSIKDNRAACLKGLTRLIEIAKLPERGRLRRWHEVTRQVSKMPWLAQELLLPLIHYQQRAEETTTRLRTAAAALAAERYRRAHGRWPDSLEALVPEYLSRVPDDAFADAPLRLRRWADRLVIYSVGLDGTANAGTVAAARSKPGTDTGTCLWDVEQRRQATAPAEAAKAASK